MAHISGKLGAIYRPAGYIRAHTISFHENAPNPDTIEDSASGFITAGFQAGQHITVIGSQSNDGTYTIANVTASVITLSSGDDLTDETAGRDVRIVSQAPGTQLSGFYSWSIDDSLDPLEVTDFGDGGWRAYIAGLKGWTGSADYYWDTDEDTIHEWSGKDVYIRFFLKYVANPSPDDPAYYLEGSAVTTRDNPTISVDAPISGRLEFQGHDSLTLVEKTTAW